MVPHVLRALGREHEVSAVSAGRRAPPARPDSPIVQRRPHLRGGRRDQRGLGDDGAAVLALEPGPAHVSAYGLTVEAGTPLARDRPATPTPTTRPRSTSWPTTMLAAAGMEWYEISNWARPGAECRHNQLYWAQGEYRGFGCAAHSHRSTGGGARRWWNVRTPERYIRLVEAGQPAEAAGEELDAADPPARGAATVTADPARGARRRPSGLGR